MRLGQSQQIYNQRSIPVPDIIQNIDKLTVNGGGSLFLNYSNYNFKMYYLF